MSSIKNYRITVLHMQQLTVSRLKKRFENSAVIIYEIVQMDNLNCSVLIKNQAMDFLIYTLFILLFFPLPHSYWTIEILLFLDLLKIFYLYIVEIIIALCNSLHPSQPHSESNSMGFCLASLYRGKAELFPK